MGPLNECADLLGFVVFEFLRPPDSLEKTPKNLGDRDMPLFFPVGMEQLQEAFRALLAAITDDRDTVAVISLLDELHLVAGIDRLVRLLGKNGVILNQVVPYGSGPAAPVDILDFGSRHRYHLPSYRKDMRCMSSCRH